MSIIKCSYTSFSPRVNHDSWNDLKNLEKSIELFFLGGGGGGGEWCGLKTENAIPFNNSVAKLGTTGITYTLLFNELELLFFLINIPYNLKFWTYSVKFGFCWSKV